MKDNAITSMFVVISLWTFKVRRVLRVDDSASPCSNRHADDQVPRWPGMGMLHTLSAGK